MDANVFAFLYVTSYHITLLFFETILCDVILT